MATIVTRSGKGAPLTHNEVDTNFTNLNTNKVEKTAVTSGQYLRGNGTDVVMSAIQAADVPTLNQNTTGTASNVTGIVAVVNGGTGTATPALVAGTNVTISGTWPNQTINSTGGGGGGTSSPIPKLQSWSIGAM